MEVKKINLSEFIKSIGVSEYEVIDKLQYFEIRELLENYNAENPIEFCLDKVEKRLDSSMLLKNVKSIITILIPYELKNEITEDNFVNIRGLITNNAWEFDYHDQLKKKLLLIAEYISKFYNELNYQVAIDTSPLVDRRLAYDANLGFYGKNTFIINENFGTRFYIGSLLISENLKIEKKDKAVLNKECNFCNDCDLCIKYCPGNALKGDYTISSFKCVSYLTQKKELLSYDERSLISDKLYGCDICQNICPYNKKELKILDEYKRKTSNVLDLFEVLKTSNKQLRKLYKSSGFIWRGPNILKRNAIIVIGNSRQTYGFDFLSEIYFDLSTEHRIYALWALKKTDLDKFYKFKNLYCDKFSLDEKNEIEQLLSEIEVIV